jgi:2-polyprenyl-3-methyl-5-hydroxy-6-metoxy-1,4-benzoquinol methylase
MNVQSAYKFWSQVYDTNENKTRDLEGVSVIETLNHIQFNACLEIGCGTGKNTAWLASKAQHVTAVDLTQEMIEKAKLKVQTPNVNFVIADILEDWNFASQQYDLATFSLVLEHIENLAPIFDKLKMAIKDNGYVYISELHPFKQYTGSKARFDAGNGEQFLDCFIHHVSDFTNIALKYGFKIVIIKEYFDENDKSHIPRLLTLLFQKVA